MPEAQPTITREKFRALKHPIQRRRFALALFFSLLLFPLIGVALAFGTVVLVVPLFALLLWVGSRTLFAYFLGNCILVSELNYPRVYKIGEDLKDTIGYHKPVSIFVYEQGNFNLFLMKFFFYRRAVFVNSELLEPGVTDDELIWAIGRFIGYLRTRREAGFWGWTIRAAEKLIVFNLFILPYERAMVLTGDRIALDVIGGNISSAVSAMQKLIVGRLLGYSVNPAGLVDQQRLVKGSFFAFLARVGKSFPHTTTRYVDLIDFARQAYPEQFARFEAENPGMPADLPRLAALPDVPPSSAGDPVWLPLVAAVILFSLLAFGVFEAVQAYQNRNATNNSSSVSAPADPSLSTSQAQPSTAVSTSDTTTNTNALPLYTSDSGKFSIQFPATPAESTQTDTLQNGDSVTSYLFTVEDSGVSYIVVYNDYPAGYIDEDPQSFLESIAEAMGKSLNGTLDTDASVELQAYPGRSFTITTDKGDKYAVDIYLNGNRLYRIMAVGSTDSSQFLQSFQML